MSDFSSGSVPGKNQPDPKRRRNKRSADRKKRGSSHLDGGIEKRNGDTQEKNTGELRSKSASPGFGKGNESAVHGGEMSQSRSKADIDHASTHPTESHNGNDKHEEAKKHGRPRKGRRRRPDTGGKENLRNVRKAPRKTPDVAFNQKQPNKSGFNESRRNKRFNGKQPRHRGRLYAALDLGTNNCRLLIAVPQSPGKFRVVDGYSRIVRLGEGLGQSGSLSHEAMDRAIEALKVCADKLGNKSIYKQRLIATEACRRAENGHEFLERVRTETGLNLEIVTGETEARLAAEGCGSLMDHKSDGAVLFDIGGGSSELILVGNASNRKKRVADRIVAWTSLPMGVVTIAETFGGKEVTRPLFDEMVKFVVDEIDRFDGKDALGKIFQGGRAHLLGTSGTVTTLAGIHLELPRYDRRQVDGIWLQDSEIDAVIDQLLSMSYEDRVRNPCIGSERADLVLAGCAILNGIRQTWPTKRLRVADRGLREGLLAEMMNGDGAWIKRPKDRWRRKKNTRARNSEGGAESAHHNGKQASSKGRNT